MCVIKRKKIAQSNEHEIREEIAYLKVSKKDGSIVETKIDAEDLQKVLEKGTWFAEWHRDFNNHLVQNLSDCITDGKKATAKQSLQSFIMGVNTKAPVKFLNGDTLDNRKANLEIFKQDAKNDFVEHNETTIAIILRDKYGKECGKSLIDKEDLDMVINYGFTWVCHKIKGEPFAVANTPDGRVFLNRIIMKTPENGVTHPINLNTLDNRKNNLENIITAEE